MAIEAQEFTIILVSGFQNDTSEVKEAHGKLASSWRGQGFEVAEVDPNWPGGDFRTTFDAIAEKTQAGLDNGKKLIRVGASAGGSTLVATRTELGIDDPVRDIPICSRFDFATEGRSPDKNRLQRISPLLVESVDHILAHRRGLNIRPDTVLAMTAGSADKRIPRNSSMPEGARIFGIGGQREHSEAVLYALANYGDRMIQFGTTAGKKSVRQ
jgi:hypothetical protein